jgi:hypothetical protein
MMEAALNEALEPMYCLARIISCHNLNGAENDAKELFLRYGIDGMKVVQSAFLCNPCINRNDRSNYIGVVQKLFDDNCSLPGNNYSLQPIPDYVSYEMNITSMNMKDGRAGGLGGVGGSGGGGTGNDPSVKRGFFWSNKKK